jgi:hypothetical protein
MQKSRERYELVIAERCDAANAGKSRRDKREHERRVPFCLMRLCLVLDDAFSVWTQLNALPFAPRITSPLTIVFRFTAV